MPGSYDFRRTICSNGHEVTRQGAVSAATMTCVNGHATKIIDALGGTPPQSQMYAKLVLGLDGRKRYETITAFDRELYQRCSALVANAGPKLILPAGELEDGENTRQAGHHSRGRRHQISRARPRTRLLHRQPGRPRPARTRPTS